MKRARVVLFSLIVFTAALLLAGFLFLSMQSPGPWKKPAPSSDIYRKSATPGLPHEHVPGAVGTIAGASVRINDLGFRGPPLSVDKPEETIRIAVLGDSIVFGQGVDEKHTLSKLLEEKLEKQAPGIDWQVINAGVRAYNSANYRVLFKEKILPLKPDLIVLVITEINDPERKPFRPSSQKLERWKDSAWKKVPLVRRFIAASYAEEINRLFEAHVEALYDNDGKQFQSFREDIRAIAEVCEANSVALIAVTFPMLADENIFKEERERLQEMLANEGIFYVDPRPAFVKIPAEKLVVGPRDFHPNRKALRIVADLLKRPVLQKTGVKGKPKKADK